MHLRSRKLSHLILLTALLLGLLSVGGCSERESALEPTAAETLVAAVDAIAHEEGCAYRQKVNFTLWDTTISGASTGSLAGDAERYVFVDDEVRVPTELGDFVPDAVEWRHVEAVRAFREVDTEAKLCSQWQSADNVALAFNIRSAGLFLSLLKSAEASGVPVADSIGDTECERIVVRMSGKDFGTRLFAGMPVEGETDADSPPVDGVDSRFDAQLWVGSKDRLPRMMVIDNPLGGQVTIDFLEWGRQKSIEAPEDVQPISALPTFSAPTQPWEDQ